MAPIVLRDYQTAAIDGIRSAYAAGSKAPLLAMSTGGGKTVCFAHIARGAAAKGNRVLILAHREEICDQISRALRELGVVHGRISPRHDMTNDRLHVGMVQTIARRIAKLQAPDLIITDEAHHSVSPTYKKVFAAWPNAKSLGVTATPARLDGRGLGDVFDRIVEAPPMRVLIDAGWLADFTYLAPPVELDLSDVKTTAGDYDKRELAVKMDRAAVHGDCVAHYRKYLDGRPAIAFAVTVAHAEHVAEQFRAAGYRAASIDGSMDAFMRRELLASIGDGRLNVLTSCELIGEGVDVPAVAGAILLRPTQSLTVHLQQIGRCLRPKPDGSRAIILDHVGNVGRHGLPDEPRAWSLEGRPKKAKAPGTTTCSLCYRVFAAATARADVQAEGCGEAAASLDPLFAANGQQISRECPIMFPVGGIKSPPPVTAGELAAVTDPWEWLRPSGINAALAAGDEFRALLKLADTKERLQLVARARKYKPGWVKHILRARGVAA